MTSAESASLLARMNTLREILTLLENLREQQDDDAVEWVVERINE